MLSNHIYIFCTTGVRRSAWGDYRTDICTLAVLFFVSIYRSVAWNIYDNMPSYRHPLKHDPLMDTNTLNWPGAPSLLLQCSDRQVWSLLFQSSSWLTSISAAATGGPNLMAAAETEGQRASWGENSSRRRTEMDGGHSGGSIRHS